MIADCDLPFAFVKQKSFRELLALVNKEAIPLIKNTNQVSIATHVTRMHQESEKTIEKYYLKKQISILFTQDAWTAPNVTAFMAVTAHFINEDFQMRELTLAVPHVEGEIFFFDRLQDLFVNIRSRLLCRNSQRQTICQTFLRYTRAILSSRVTTHHHCR
jgi:hypothetical protein